MHVSEIIDIIDIESQMVDFFYSRIKYIRVTPWSPFMIRHTEIIILIIKDIYYIVG